MHRFLGMIREIVILIRMAISLRVGYIKLKLNWGRQHALDALSLQTVS